MTQMVMINTDILVIITIATISVPPPLNFLQRLLPQNTDRQYLKAGNR
jgi:hypothetical protein